MKKATGTRAASRAITSNRLDVKEIREQLISRFPANSEHVPWILNVTNNNDVSQERDLYATVSNFIDACTKYGMPIPQSAILFYLPRPFGFAAFILANEAEAILECVDTEFVGQLIQKNKFGTLWEFRHKPARAKFKGIVKIRQKDGGISAELPVSWDVKWFIEETTSGFVRGWIADVANPTLPINVSVFSGSKVVGEGKRAVQRSDVADALEVNYNLLGFEVRYPVPSSSLYNIRVRPSGVNFDLLSGGANYVASSYPQRFTRQLRRAMDHVNCQNAVEDRFIRLLKKQVTAETYSNFVKGSSKLFPLLLPRPTSTSSLSVIIPVYSGLEETKRCIESVLNCETKLSLEIIIGYDAGPDDRLKAYLEGLSDSRLKIEYRSKNLGFVKNVNQLVASKKNHDFLLLNADTVVSDFLFDRMVEALDHDRSYASLSPVSNNATIFSIYHAPNLVGKEFLSEVNTKLHEQWGPTIAPVPVSHGYCMLVNGDAYAICGLFDEETWGKGYGEETDWCQRILAKTGMRHGAMLGAYVFHEGSVSFGLDQMTTRVTAANHIINERYPDYHETIDAYQVIGRLNQKKIRSDMSLMRGRINGPLIITHYYGGGIETYINSRIKELDRTNSPYLIAQYFHGEGASYWKIFGSLITERYFPVEDLPAMTLWLATLGVTSVEYEHSGDASLKEVIELIQILDLPLKTNLHDFALLCPRINLLDYANRYCSVQDELTCEICVIQGGPADSAKRAYTKLGSVSELRQSAKKLFSISSEIYTPSNNTKELYQKVFSGVGIKAKPHHGAIKFSQRKAKSRSSKTVCVIGAISAAKGMIRYKELADYLQKKDSTIRVVFIGYTQNDALFSPNSNVVINGKYNLDKLASLVDQYDATACLHLNCWPETFSYTLSESLAVGLYPFYTNIGAVGERLKQARLGRGYDLDAPVSSIAADLIKFFNGAVR